MRSLARAVALVLLAAAAAVDGAAQREGGQPAAQLLIDAVAHDRHGMPVTDLRREELEVWIRGYRVPFDSFRSVTPDDSPSEGRLIVVLLDDLVLPAQLVPRARDTARRFVNRLLPGDEMAILTLNRGGMESTGDRERLLRAIDSYHSRAVGVQRFDVIGANVLQTLTAIARQLAEASSGRKVIVGIGAAWLFDTPIPPPTVGRDLRDEWVDAMRAMALANASLYIIEPGGVGSTPFPSGTSGLARETGGHAFVNTNDLAGAADRILREASNYYLIGVSDPPVQRNARLRDLDVRVLRDGVTVRARRSVPGSR